MRNPWILLLLALLFFPFAASAEEAAPSPLLLIFDASGSMWGQIEGVNKIVVAREVLAELVDDLPEETEVGLIAYGHRREGDCADIETLTPLARLDREAIKKSVDALNPKGKTPITDSLRQAFDLLRAEKRSATVVLVSDGLETCGGDPCATVRAAKEEGLELILHVVGFDVAGEDVSQLECAAQAGGGLFMSAENADELGAALDAAVAMPVDLPIGRLAVRAVADGELQDVAVHVLGSDGKHVAGARTYRSEETNPSSIPLADGVYRVEVKATGIKGDIDRAFEIEIVAGSTVEKTVDFSTGEIAVGATKNGADLADATFSIRVAGTNTEVAAGRTYVSEKTNPKSVRITSGTYDVSLSSVKIKGKPTQEFPGVVVEPGGTIELLHDFESGTLRLGAVRGEELIDVTLSVVDLESGKSVAQGRTYADPKSNPKTFEVPPGSYRVTAKAVRLDGNPKREFEVRVEAGATIEESARFDP